MLTLLSEWSQMTTPSHRSSIFVYSVQQRCWSAIRTGTRLIG